MKFSTVIPLYNKQNTIERAVYSVLGQDCSNNELNEIIVIDDGSTDDSLNIIEKIKAEFSDRNIRIVSQANAGVSSARNHGVALAKNEYITFLDADDTYESHFYSEISKLATRFPFAAVLATAYRFVNTSQGTKRNADLVGLGLDEHQIMDDFFYSAAFGDLPVTSSSVCIKRKALNNIGGFPVGENMGEDQAVWSQLALKYLIALSKNVCANYFEDTGDSLMQTQAVTHEMPYSLRLQSQVEKGDVADKFHRSVEQYIAGHLLDLVRRNSASGNLAVAKKMLTDKRSRVQLKRWCYWYIRVLFKRITSA